MPISNDAGLNEVFEVLEELVVELSQVLGLTEPLSSHERLCELLGRELVIPETITIDASDYGDRIDGILAEFSDVEIKIDDA